MSSQYPPSRVSNWVDAHNPHHLPSTQVLHLRNLPPDATEHEVQALCHPYGALVQVKRGVGTLNTQAFCEFASLDDAMRMAGHCADGSSSTKPALQLRGRAVYVQFSAKQHIESRKRPADEPALAMPPAASSPVLLVTFEGLPPGASFHIDHLHAALSPIAPVHKISVFEKQAGFQALVQFDSPATAQRVLTALHGTRLQSLRSSTCMDPPTLRLCVSPHRDLNVRVQSDKTRDYVQTHLPTAKRGALGDTRPRAPPPVQPSPVLRVTIDNVATEPVTVHALHSLFSAYGTVQKVCLVDRPSTARVALVQYAEASSAAVALGTLQGYCMRGQGAHKLSLVYSVHQSLNVSKCDDKSWDYTLQPMHGVAQPLMMVPPGVPRPRPPPGQPPRPMHSLVSPVKVGLQGMLPVTPPPMYQRPVGDSPYRAWVGVPMMVVPRPPPSHQ